jgi:hypothetical protein
MKDWLTFDEWKDEGFMVVQGEKATWFNDVPKFSKFQVEEVQFDGFLTDGTSPWEDCYPEY